MMRRFYNTISLTYFTVLFYFFLSPVLAQNPAYAWTKTAGTSNDEEGRSVVCDASGNIYVTGYFEGSCDFDPGPGVVTLTSNTREAFFAKYNPTGSLIWAKQFGGNGTEEGYGIALDPSGNVLITGYFVGAVDFDPGSSTYTVSSGGQNAVFLAKYTSNGNFIWAIGMGSGYGATGVNLTVDVSGNPHIVGYFSNTVDFDPGSSTANLTASGSYDVFFAKYDSNGNYLWAKKIGGSLHDSGNEITVDGSGDVVISGYFDGTVDFDPGVGTATVTSLGGFDFFYAKYDALGNYIWANRIGGSAHDQSFSHTRDAAGNIFLTGYFSEFVDFDPGLGTLILGNQYFSLPFIAKYGSNGNLVWAKVLEDYGFSIPFSIILDANLNIVIAGSMGDSLDFDPGIGVANRISNGLRDIFVAKYDNSGNYLWARSVGGGAEDRVDDVAIDQCGNIVFTGCYNFSSVDFDPGSTVDLLSNAGVDDLFVTKYAGLSATANFNTLCSGQAATITASGSGAGATYTWNPGGLTGSLVVVNPTTTTIYSLSSSSPSGCIDNSTIQIVASSSPPTTISVNSASVCLGNSFTLVPSGATSYTFSGGNAVITPSSTTVYSVIGTNSAGCISQNIAVATISVFALPLPTVSVNSGTVCTGNTFTIMPTGASSYSYSGGSSYVSPSITTSYSVTGSNSLGCVSMPAVSSVSVFPFPLPIITVNSGTICSGQSFTIVPSGAMSYTFSSASSVVNPVSNTSYSIYGSNSNGCVSSVPAISNVSVYITPSLTVNSGSICIGQSFTIVPFGAQTYTISGGNYVVTPTATTTYTLIGNSQAGCPATGISISSVSVFPLPVVTIVTSASIICAGETVTLTASGTNFYSWQNQSLTASIVVIPLITTTYIVTGQNSFGCTSNFSITQTVDMCTDIKGFSTSLTEVKIFPNPTENTFFIEGGIGSEIVLLNSIGKIVLSQHLENYKTPISVENLPNGIYLLKFETNTRSYGVRLIKR
jgi:hypothetical protein